LAVKKKLWRQTLLSHPATKSNMSNSLLSDRDVRADEVVMCRRRRRQALGSHREPDVPRGIGGYA
jgi:hypothetical protein